MQNFKTLSLFLLIASALLVQPLCSWAGDTEMELQVDKGDIVWSQSDITGKQIYYSTYSNVNSSWSTPVKVSSDTYRNGYPVVDAGKDGSRWLVWVAGSGNSYMLRYSIETEGSWSNAATIPSPLQVNLAPSVVVDSSGVAWVAWSGNNGGQDEIYSSSYQDDAWTTPVQVNATNQVPDILPEITINANGNPQVTWQGFRNGDYMHLRSTWDGKAWSTESQVESTATQSSSTPTSSATASSQKTASQASRSARMSTSINGSISNMPRFIKRPEKAYLRVYKSVVVK